MAGLFDAHVLSQSSLGWGHKDVAEGNHQLFQDNVPLDDTVALDSSLDETQLETLDFDTEVADNPYHLKDVTTHSIVEYENEVALDSESEGNCSSDFASVTNWLSDVKQDRRLKENAVGSQKRQLGPPFMQLEDLAETSDGSAGVTGLDGNEGALVINESPAAGRSLPQMHACDQVFSGLNYISSEEPRETSQANALDFVNHYLSLNNAGFSPGTKCGNAVKKEMCPISGIKGCQSLAKQIKTRTPVGRDGTFEWVDRNHRGGDDFFSKRIDAAFGLKGSRKRSALRDQKAGQVYSKGSSSSDNKHKQKCVNLHKKVTSSPCSDSRTAVDGQKETSKMEQASEINFENKFVTNINQHLPAEQEPDSFSIEGNMPDMLDVGFSTQLAAEAMEALSYGLPSDSILQCHQNLLVDSSTGVTSNIHLKKPCVQKDALEGIARTSKRGKSSARKGSSNSSLKHSIHQKLGIDLTITKRRKRSKCLTGRSNGINTTNTSKSPKPAKEGILEEATGKNNNKKCENYGSLSKPFEPVVCQTGLWMAEGTLKATKNEPDNLEKMNNVVQGSIVTYKRKRSHLGAKPFGVWRVEEKCAELCCKQLRNEEPFAHKSMNCTIGLLEEAKYRPDNQGKKTKAIIKDSIITYRRRNNAFSAKLSESSSAEEKKATLCCNVSAAVGNNKLTQIEQGSLDITSLLRTFKFNSWSCSKRKRTHSNRPSHSFRANNQYISSMVNDPKEVYKRPFNKNLPKSSLLKEIIRLGMPEQKFDFSRRDLRKRRGMASVQVLLSQHLDDDIIKQQKKIIARLGISVASCSTDATHFVADKFVRTRNMLEAIAFGKPVVTHLWLESCGQACCLIDEKNYILRDAKKEKEIGFSMPVSLAHAGQYPLLKSRRVLLTPNIQPDKEMITSLIKALHGKLVAESEISALKIPDDLLILSCKEDHAMCMPFLDKGAVVYSSELLLNGIVIQKLDYERHQLFRNPEKRSRRPNKR